MKSSRIPGFYKMSVSDRKKMISEIHNLSNKDLQLFDGDALSVDTADNMIENVVGTYSLPLGLGLNFLINDRDYTIPMAVEEASVVASASYIAKVVRDAGGFTTEATDRVMIGQIQVIGSTNLHQAKDAILKEKESLLQQANKAYPSIVARGGRSEEHTSELQSR